MDALKEAEVVAEDNRRVPIITYTVERYNGKVQVLLWGKDGLGIRTDKDFPLTVNGVEVYCDIHFQVYDGQWEIKRTEKGYTDWYAVSVRNTRDFERSSDSAYRKVLEVAEDLVKYTTESRPSAVIQGEVHRLNRELWRANRKQADLQGEMHQTILLVGDLQHELAEQQVKWATTSVLEDNDELPPLRHAYVVTLESTVYGIEQFTYDDEDEALAGFQRVQESARMSFKEDGVLRTVRYLGWVEVE